MPISALIVGATHATLCNPQIKVLADLLVSLYSCGITNARHIRALGRVRSCCQDVVSVTDVPYRGGLYAGPSHLLDF